MMLVHRGFATEQTCKKYRERAFDWKRGATCIHLAHDQATAMGHSLPMIPGFTTAKGAVRALKRQGHDTLESLLDAYFERIPASRMLIGDLAMLPGEAPFNAVLIYDGLSKLLGWHEVGGNGIVPVVHATDHIMAAWRL